MNDIEVQKAVAVLENEVKHVTARVEEVRDEMRASMAGVNTKLDGIVQQLTVQKEVGKLRARLVALGSHATTGGLTLLAAKVLHLPINFG